MTEKSALENLPMQVSQTEIAERNRQHWNTPHEIVAPPVVPATAPPVSPSEPSTTPFPEKLSVPQVVELGTGKHGAPNDIVESPVNNLPERISQRELAEPFGDYWDKVDRNPPGASSLDPNKPASETEPPWPWYGPGSAAR